MKKIIAFAGSNSKNSINKRLAVYTANQVKNTQVIVLDLNDYKLPLFGVDYQAEFGVPDSAKQFLEVIKSADGIILSLAEHNGAYSVAFKNILDWMSRIEGKLWNYIPMLLMATSNGGRGAISVLEIAKRRFPHMGGNIIADYSLPFFSQNFSDEGILNEDLKVSLHEAIIKFENAIN